MNMDEMPVYFDLLPSKTVYQKGDKSVLIRTTGSEKRHFTCVLAVSADGTVLPPMIIFMGKRELRLDCPAGWIVTVQENGWMDETLMLKWIKDIYLKYTKKERSLLVLDSFHGYLSDDVKKAFVKEISNGSDFGRMHVQVQPPDVSTNKQFKVDLWKSLGSYMR